MNKEFNKYIDRLYTKYDENPSKTLEEVRSLLLRLGDNLDSINEKKSFLKDIGKEKLYTIIIISFIVLIGLSNITNIDSHIPGPLYFFGLIFFLAGYYVSQGVPIFGLIFLFSHGGTGLFIMISSMAGDILTSPVIEDLSRNMQIYLLFTSALLVVAIFMCIFNNLSKTLKNRRYYKIIPLFIFSIALLLVRLIPIVINLI